MSFHTAALLELLKRAGIAHAPGPHIDLCPLASLLDPRPAAEEAGAAAASPSASLRELLAQVAPDDGCLDALVEAGAGCTGAELCCLEAARAFAYVTKAVHTLQAASLSSACTFPVPSLYLPCTFPVHVSGGLALLGVHLAGHAAD